jgi:seryl-tRNA synthetase
MHDLRYLRGNREAVEAGVRRKRVEVDLDSLYEAEAGRLTLLTEVEELKRRRNQESERIGQLKKSGEDAAGPISEMKKVSQLIKEKEGQQKELEEKVARVAAWIPNFAHESVPDGEGEEDNVVLGEVGEKPQFDFTPKPHWEIAENLGIIDFERGAKIAGSGFPLFVGDGARLVHALIYFMMDLHTDRHGYTQVHTPIVVRTDSLVGTGQLPKLADDMYRLEGTDLWLNPTAEVPVTNIYRDEILDPGDIPTRLTAYCPSFRQEAGAAGRDTRGIIRLHQFDKVELVRFTLPENSYHELEALRGDVEATLTALEMPYRVLELCTADLSFAAAKCYDFESWAAGEGRWLEVSSCSNFEQFQARRAGIRFRREKGAKAEFVATLNASGLALPRTIVTLLENGQRADGSVAIPRALQPYMGGREALTPSG